MSDPFQNWNEEDKKAAEKARDLEQPVKSAYQGISPNITLDQMHQFQPQEYNQPQYQSQYQPQQFQNQYQYQTSNYNQSQYQTSNYNQSQYQTSNYNQSQYQNSQEPKNEETKSFVPSKEITIDPSKKKLSEEDVEKRFDGTLTCRCCHGGIEEGKDFISPCKCTGTMKYVHRHCLDQWRTYSPNPKSFFYCDVCGEAYKFEPVTGNLSTIKKILSYLKFFSLIAVDFFVVILIWQLLVAICTVVIMVVDFYGYRYQYIYEALHLPMVDIPIIKGLLYDYVLGLITFFFLLGVFASVAGLALGIAFIARRFMKTDCSGCEGSSGVSYDSYHYHHHYSYDFDWFLFYFCWWSYMWNSPYYYSPMFTPVECFCCTTNQGMAHSPGCNCNGDLGDTNCSGSDANCGDLKCSGGGGDAGGIFVVIGVVILVVIAIFVAIGVFVGIIVFTFIAFKILNRRYYILKRKEDIKFYRVADLNLY